MPRPAAPQALLTENMMLEVDDVSLDGHPLAHFERTVHTSLPQISLSPALQPYSSRAPGCLAKTLAQPGIPVDPSHLPGSVQQKDFPSSLLW